MAARPDRGRHRPRAGTRRPFTGSVHQAPYPERMLRRRGLVLAALGGVVVLVAVVALVVYLTLLRAPGDISHPDVTFKPEPTATATATPSPSPSPSGKPDVEERPDQLVTWPRYGYTL